MAYGVVPYSVGMKNPLREFRRSQGLTQQALGDLLGVTQSTVAGWESRRRSLAVADVSRLGELGADVMELVQWSSVDLTPDSQESAA